MTKIRFAPRGEWPHLDRFKAAFHRCREVMEGRQGHLRLSMLANEEQVETAVAVPDESEAARLAILIDQFAHPEAELFAPRLLNSFLLSVQVSPEVASELESVWSVCTRLPIMLRVHGKTLDGPEIFRLVADSGFLRRDEEVALEFSEVTEGLAPTRPMLLYLFHCYCLQVQEFLEQLYYAVRKAETEGLCCPPTESMASSPQCIYCLESASLFDSVEHVYPESLGNTDLILPRGHVCDKCNHGTLSELDQHLVEHEIIGLPKVFALRVNPRTGQYTRSTTQGFHLVRYGPQAVRIVDTGMSRSERHALNQGNLRFRGRGPFDAQLLGRSLFKVALGLVSHHAGHVVALHPRYDSARAFIRGLRPFPNYFSIDTEIQPNHQVEGNLEISQVGTIASLSIFGVGFRLNLEHLPVLPHQLFLSSIRQPVTFWLGH